jgi:hypothetical protein
LFVVPLLLSVLVLLPGVALVLTGRAARLLRLLLFPRGGLVLLCPLLLSLVLLLRLVLARLRFFIFLLCVFLLLLGRPVLLFVPLFVLILGARGNRGAKKQRENRCADNSN